MLNLDGQLFDLLNGLAGRCGWCDAAIAWLALFGAPALAALALWPVWWPGWPADARRGYRRSLLFAVAFCLACYALELLLTDHLLGHDLRSRPANGRWATVLLTVDSGMAFPAWPMAIAGLLLPAVRHMGRRLSVGMTALTALLGAALVIAGVNYPLDVLAGLALGLLLGWAGTRLARFSAPADLQPPVARPRVRMGAAALVLVLAIGTASLLTLHTDGSRTPTAPQPTSPRIDPPAAMTAALTAAVAPHPVRLEAATNGHLHVAAGYITVPPDADLATVQTAARNATNAAFASWPELDLLTLAVEYRKDGRAGTLYTATVAREDVPTNGFAPDKPLPGAKFYHARFMRGQ